jgi:transcriptional regulator with PAS, ATPase and Fis domain
LFLDEIGDLPSLTQAKILRVLQEKEVRRLGGRDSFKVDVRIIAATNKDLEKEMGTGKFREDLFYRLKVVSISLPPLRERKEDIPELAEFFLLRYNHEFGKKITKIDDAAIRAFCEYQWPGNIRQFESVIEKAVLMCESDMISIDDIRSELQITSQSRIIDFSIPEEGVSLDEIETYLLRKAMAKSGNVVARAAKLLGLTYKTFWYRWEKIQNEGYQEKIPLEIEIPDEGLNLEDIERILLKQAMARSNNVIARAARLLDLSDKAFRLRWEKYGMDAPNTRLPQKEISIP